MGAKYNERAKFSGQEWLIDHFKLSQGKLLRMDQKLFKILVKTVDILESTNDSIFWNVKNSFLTWILWISKNNWFVNQKKCHLAPYSKYMSPQPRQIMLFILCGIDIKEASNMYSLCGEGKWNWSLKKERWLHVITTGRWALRKNDVALYITTYALCKLAHLLDSAACSN